MRYKKDPTTSLLFVSHRTEKSGLIGFVVKRMNHFFSENS